MKILIDTHIFLWAIAEPHKLSKKHKEELERLSNIIYVSSVTITELMIKSSLGKLKIDFDPISVANESGFELLDFSCEDALRLKDMPFHHKDPFDRMIISQATNQKLYLMSDDGKFRLYDCKLI